MSGITDWWKKKKEPRQPAGPPPPVHIDLYDALGITPSASSDDIKAAFRSLALKFHPDRNQGDPAAAKKYTEISTAYAILGDEVQRAAYDHARAGAPPAPAPPPPPPPVRRDIVPRPGTPEEPSRQAKKEEKAPAKEPPGQMSMWEMMFSKTEEKKGPTGSLFDMFVQEGPPPPEIPSAQSPFGWAAPFHKVPLTPSIDTPASNELFYFVEHEWPLEGIWDTVRQGRHTEEFYKTRSMVVDVLGGGGQTPAEWDMADMFGIPKRQVDEFILNRDRQAFFGEILHPIFDQVTQFMGQLKPADLPGQFFIDWDATGKVLMLIYAESVGRRPWE